MIMPIAAALTLQAAQLPTDQAHAATTCIAVLSAQDTSAGLDWFVAVNYLSLVSASEEQDRDVLQGIARAVSTAQTKKSAIGARERRRLSMVCRARFPLAWSKSATLPRDAFERRFLCATITGSYEGLLDTIAQAVDVSTERRRVRSKSAHLGALATNAYAAAHGLDNQAKLYAAVQNVFRKSVAQGNVRALNAACEAAFPS